MTRIILKKGKRGHKDTHINLSENLTGKERQNMIASLKHQYRDVEIIDK